MSNNNNRANGGGGNKVKDLINDIEKGMREDDIDNDEQEVDHHPSLSSIDGCPPPLPAPTAPRLSNINYNGTNEVVPVDDNADNNDDNSEDAETIGHLVAVQQQEEVDRVVAECNNNPGKSALVLVFMDSCVRYEI